MLIDNSSPRQTLLHSSLPVTTDEFKNKLNSLTELREHAMNLLHRKWCTLGSRALQFRNPVYDCTSWGIPDLLLFDIFPALKPVWVVVAATCHRVIPCCEPNARSDQCVDSASPICAGAPKLRTAATLKSQVKCKNLEHQVLREYYSFGLWGQECTSACDRSVLLALTRYRHSSEPAATYRQRFESGNVTKL